MLLTDLAPVGKLLWHEVNAGHLEVIDAGGRKKSFVYDKEKVAPGRVMAGGERIFEVSQDEKKAQCVVLADGQVFGCLPFVEFGSTTVNGRTFFWTSLQDGSIAAYMP